MLFLPFGPLFCTSEQARLWLWHGLHAFAVSPFLTTHRYLLFAQYVHGSSLMS
jgi:hypothetical protein